MVHPDTAVDTNAGTISVGAVGLDRTVYVTLRRGGGKSITMDDEIP